MTPLEKKDQKLCSPEDVKKLFSNLKTLLDITYSVLNTMEQRKRKKESGGYVIGDVFANLAEDFKAYTVYCINHPFALDTLETLRKSTTFTNWEQSLLENPETKGIGLVGYLIKPVQR
jgi:hypothetical protein